MLYALPSGRVIIQTDCPGDLIKAPEPSKRQITVAWDRLIHSLSPEQIEILETPLFILQKALKINLPKEP